MAFVCNHLHLRSEDPDNAAKFYVDNFGAEIVSTRPLSNTVSHQLELNGQPLLTVSGEAEGENAVPGSTHPRFGLDHFGFETDDIQGAFERFKSTGANIIWRAVDDAVGIAGHVRGSAGQGEPGDHPATCVAFRDIQPAHLTGRVSNPPREVCRGYNERRRADETHLTGGGYGIHENHGTSRAAAIQRGRVFHDGQGRDPDGRRWDRIAGAGNCSASTTDGGDGSPWRNTTGWPRWAS